MFEKTLQERSRYLAGLIDTTRARMKKAPEGSLRVAQRGNQSRYYHRVDPKDTTGIYLGKGNDELIRGLAQKAYDEKVTRAAEREKKLIDKLLGFYQSEGGTTGDALVEVYDSLSPARKALVSPYAISDDDYAAVWLEEEFQPKEIEDGAAVIFTENGEKVRSKSEAIIADKLARNEIPYRYECPLFLGGRKPIYPDFTVLNKGTREVWYWEHLGLMDDGDYRERALSKIAGYERRGLFPGKGLILTYESERQPLDTRVVDGLIEAFLI